MTKSKNLTNKLLEQWKCVSIPQKQWKRVNIPQKLGEKKKMKKREWDGDGHGTQMTSTARIVWTCHDPQMWSSVLKPRQGEAESNAWTDDHFWLSDYALWTFGSFKASERWR